jgi:hypothetical protein
VGIEPTYSGFIVDQEGIEPSIQVCKTRVFPLALPAHNFVPRVGFAPTHLNRIGFTDRCASLTAPTRLGVISFQ